MNEKKILVAVDGSDNSERALIEARKHGDAFGAEITILTVLNQSSAKSPGKRDQNWEETGQVILTESLKLFDDFKGEVITTVRNGDPADEILEEAEFGDFDLIIMGNRGLGIFSRTFLGSVSNKVLNHTKKNVLVIK